MKNTIVIIFLVLGLIFGCDKSETKASAENQSARTEQIHPENYWGDSPWPEIRKKRIDSLLPIAMTSAKVDAWFVVCRENNNDPLADHIGGENAGGTAVFLFFTDENGFNSFAFSPIGESTALDDLNVHDKVIPVDRGQSAIAQALDFVKSKDLQKIAINTSSTNSLADGLTYSQYQEISELMGDDAENLVSSTELVYEWLSVKLPEEVEILRQAAQLTADWQIEAYEKVIPGETTDADIARFLKNKMKIYGVGDAWSPDQNPNVNSGPDRGHSHATDKVIMPGDVIQIDFGIKVYDRWVSDIQRFAYVFKGR